MTTTSKLHNYFIREKIIQNIRQFFFDKKFHEVTPLLLNKALPLESNLYAFSTTWRTRNHEETFYLPASPEIAMKKLLAKGIGNCFAIGKSFRNLEGAGSQHSPEFMMLEWYRENATYEKIMQDTQELIRYINKNTVTLTYQHKTIDIDTQWPIFSLVDLFKKYAHLDMLTILDDNVLIEKAKEKHYQTKGSSWHQLFDQIFVNEIEPNLPSEPFFLVDFPARISPLCKLNKTDLRLAERFEFYMFNMELANGNNENTDYKAVEEAMNKEKEYRQSMSVISPPIDKEFIKALQIMDQSGRSYAGIGMGIDRLAMIFADTDSISNLELL